MRVVLGPGLAPGLAGIGVLMELEASGVGVVEVIGANTGALGAALWGIDSDLQLAARVIAHLSWPTYCVARDLGEDDPLLSALDTLTRRASLEALSRKVRIVLSDLKTGTVQVARRGSLARLVRGSMAIPGIFHPLAEPGGTLAADPGSRWHDAVRAALGQGAATQAGHFEHFATLWVMCLPVAGDAGAGAPGHFSEPVRMWATYAGRSWSEPPQGEERRLTFAGDAGGYLSFENASEWIEAGRRAVRAWLAGKEPASLR